MSSVKELPKVPYFAIIFDDTKWIEGYDANDRGYSTHAWGFEFFTDKKEWEDRIVQLSKDTGYNKKVFQAVVVNPARVTVSVAVNIDEPVDF